MHNDIELTESLLAEEEEENENYHPDEIKLNIQGLDDDYEEKKQNIEATNTPAVVDIKQHGHDDDQVDRDPIEDEKPSRVSRCDVVTANIKAALSSYAVIIIAGGISTGLGAAIGAYSAFCSKGSIIVGTKIGSAIAGGLFATGYCSLRESIRREFDNSIVRNLEEIKLERDAQADIRGLRQMPPELQDIIAVFEPQSRAIMPLLR